MKGKQGFASMSEERRKELASKGGKKTHELGKRYKWDTEEAGKAGKKARTLARIKKEMEEHES